MGSLGPLGFAGHGQDASWKVADQGMVADSWVLCPLSVSGQGNRYLVKLGVLSTTMWLFFGDQSHMIRNLFSISPPNNGSHTV